MKKTTKIVLVIFTIILLYSGIVFTDVCRVSALKKPIFSIENGYMGSMTRYDGLGYTIGLDINATTGEITYGQISALGEIITRVRPD